ncbi:MAG: metallophosphoesterase, partial [Lachnospiraceae bacterium]|nr:metallophosphoesterase [Lachnospiraceae bacterium]MBR1568039.1 metallophosphoesterase [Lachnospiraceae bacterium]
MIPRAAKEIRKRIILEKEDYLIILENQIKEIEKKEKEEEERQKAEEEQRKEEENASEASSQSVESKTPATETSVTEVQATEVPAATSVQTTEAAASNDNGTERHGDGYTIPGPVSNILSSGRGYSKNWLYDENGNIIESTVWYNDIYGYVYDINGNYEGWNMYYIRRMRMARIWLAGDTHGEIDLGKVADYFDDLILYDEVTKEDYLIILGDVGVCWDGGAGDAFVQECLHNLPCTVLFIDGNHENFDLLEQYPEEEWHGGNVQYIQEDIIHLMRGQVYEIGGRRFFTFGGGNSIDRMMRTTGISWWPEEMPSDIEYSEGLRNL